MFYITRNIETEIYFTHHDMNLIANEQIVMQRLKQKVEGYCDQEYGYLIQVIKSTTSQQMAMVMDKTQIRRDGLYIFVKFSCITFRPNKNQVFPIIVNEISESGIMGKIGSANVMVPQLKIFSAMSRYNNKENNYLFFCENNRDESVIIKPGSIIYCQCFDMRTQMNCTMRILGSINKELIQLAIDKQFG